MRKFMVPLALAFAMSASGAAFAATQGNPHAYRFGNQHASTQSMDTAGTQSASSTSDPRVDPNEQQASMPQERTYVTMPSQSQQNLTDPWADGDYGPSGPE